jgi:CRP/FNR family cyclic AMP-dependent transcriptional regulator
MTPHELTLAIGAVAVVLTIASDLMRRMVPLRALAIAANATFAVRSTINHDYVDLTLQVGLFCINAYRLWDLRRLIVAIESAKADAPLTDWLLPYMRKKTYAAGTTLFNKGDDAHFMVYIRTGTVRIVEAGLTLGPGALVGEIGIFASHRKRTASIVCETKCVCYTMTDEAIHLLYFQNPALGFYLIRLIVQRLLQDLERRPAVANA